MSDFISDGMEVYINAPYVGMNHVYTVMQLLSFMLQEFVQIATVVFEKDSLDSLLCYE